MTSWNLMLRRWFFCSAVILACILVSGLNLIVVEPAAARVPELRRVHEEGLEGDPGDGVLSPGSLQGADDGGSSYVDPETRRLPQLRSAGYVLVIDGLAFHPFLPGGAAFYPIWWAGQSRANDSGGRTFSRMRSPYGDVSDVLDEGGCRYAP